MNSREDLANIFKRNRRMAELNPDVAAEVLAAQNRPVSETATTIPFDPETPATPQQGLNGDGKKAQRDYKAEFLQQLALMGIAPPKDEYRFCERKWRFDWAYPDKMVAIEYQGGAYYKGMGHQTTAGFTKDCLKFSTAASLGWRIILVTAGMVRDGSAARLIETALTRQ